MRILGILLIIAGLFYAVAKPLFNAGPAGEEVARTLFFDRSNTSDENKGWQVSKIFLEKDKNPLNIRITIFRMTGKLDEGRNLKLLVRVAPVSQSGTTLPSVLNQPVTIDLEGGDSGSQSPSGQMKISVSTKEFEIEQTGQFKIGAFPIAADNVTIGKPELEIDGKIIRIEAILTGSAEAGNSSNSLLGVGLVVLGIIMLSLFRRRKNRQNAQVPPDQIQPENDMQDRGLENPAPRSEPPVISDEAEPKRQPARHKRETDIGKTIQWGRDADKD